MIMFALVLTPQPDEIPCEKGNYGCGGKMQRVYGLFDRGQPVYECACGNQRTLPPDGGWICPDCGCAVEEIYGDNGLCLECHCRRAHTTLTMEEWVKKHLNPIHNPQCLGARCPEGLRI